MPHYQQLGCGIISLTYGPETHQVERLANVFYYLQIAASYFYCKNPLAVDDSSHPPYHLIIKQEYSYWTTDPQAVPQLEIPEAVKALMPCETNVVAEAPDIEQPQSPSKDTWDGSDVLQLACDPSIYADYTLPNSSDEGWRINRIVSKHAERARRQIMQSLEISRKTNSKLSRLVLASVPDLGTIPKTNPHGAIGSEREKARQEEQRRQQAQQQAIANTQLAAQAVSNNYDSVHGFTPTTSRDLSDDSETLESPVQDQGSVNVHAGSKPSDQIHGRQDSVLTPISYAQAICNRPKDTPQTRRNEMQLLPMRQRHVSWDGAEAQNNGGGSTACARERDEARRSGFKPHKKSD